jgi:molecular chaperone DnaK (HSP70)
MSDSEANIEEVEVKDQSELFSDDDDEKFNDVAEQIKNKITNDTTMSDMQKRIEEYENKINDLKGKSSSFLSFGRKFK